MHHDMISVIPRKQLIVELHFSKFRCCKPTALPKNTSSQFFSFEFGQFFFRKDIKSNSRCIAQKILSKEVKQVPQRRGRCERVATELAKENNMNL